MRKRSNYRPKPVTANPMAWAIAGARPMSDEIRAKVNAPRHLALVKLAEGNASTYDLTVLLFVSHIAREVAKTGIGVEGLALADQAQHAIDCAYSRALNGGSAKAEPGEYEILQALVTLVDMQSQSMPLNAFERCQRAAGMAAGRPREVAAA